MAAEDIDEGVRDEEVDTRCTLDSFNEVEQVKDLIAQLQNILDDLNAQEIALQKFKRESTGFKKVFLCHFLPKSTKFEIHFVSLRSKLEYLLETFLEY